MLHLFLLRLILRPAQMSTLSRICVRTTTHITITHEYAAHDTKRHRDRVPQILRAAHSSSHSFVYSIYMYIYTKSHFAAHNNLDCRAPASGYINIYTKKCASRHFQWAMALFSNRIDPYTLRGLVMLCLAPLYMIATVDHNVGQLRQHYNRAQTHPKSAYRSQRTRFVTWHIWWSRTNKKNTHIQATLRHVKSR